MTGDAPAGDEGRDTEEEAQSFLVDAVGELSAEDVDRLLRGLPPPLATEVVTELLGSKLDPRRLKNLGALLVSALRKRSAARLSPVVERLSTGVLDTFESELGDRFEDPSVDDLRQVLDAVLAKHPAAGVRCTLSLVVAEQMPAADAAREVLVSDPRLCLAVWNPTSEGAS